ncbi:MAG: ATP-binding protein [bacterium]
MYKTWRGTFFLASIAAIAGTTYCFFYGLTGYLPLYYVALTLLAMGAVVFLYNWRNKINIMFALMTMAMAGIVIGYAVLFNVPPSILALLGVRGIYASAFLLILLLFYFSSFFPFEKEKLGLARQAVVVVPIISLAITAFFTSYVVVDVLPGRQVAFGPLFPIFVLFSLFLAGYSIGLLLNKIKEASSLQQKQIKYVIIGLLVFGAPIFMADVISPLVFHNYRFIGPAFYLIIPGAGLMAYAIIRHRLMTVEVALQHSVVYALSTMMLMAIYALAVMVSEIYLRKIVGYSSQAVAAIIVVIIAIMYQPLVHGFQNFTDRLFFKGRYDYRKTLRKISREIASVIKLEQLARLIALSFVNTMKISEISFLSRDKEEEKFYSIPLNVPRYQKIEISAKSPIVQWLAAAKDILVLDEVEDEITKQEALGEEGQTRKAYLEEVKAEIERLGIALWVPIIAKGELTGIIALGSKLSGDVFTSEDLALLNTLSNQTAVALENARLYEEVLVMKNYNEEILQSMTNGVLTTDAKGRIITFNFMAENITGREALKAIGKRCEEVWGPRGAVTAAINRTLRGEPCLNYETGIASPERGLVPVSFSTTLLKDGQGKILGALLSINDLSGIKEMEYKIRRADKLTALATMAAGMAHEIKNPLSSMKVFAQLLPKKIDDPEYRKKLEEILPKEIDRIDKIVENLLGFARSTTPTFELASIEGILEENIKYFEEKARASGITIKQDYQPLPEIEIDHGQISQVFSNLILNAIQAMTEGGEIVVATSPGQKTDGVLQNIKVKVSDTGHGISEEIKKKLFDPFFTTKYGGTGLGLAISHSIVDGHKGSIDVESQVGKGTSFTVTLPQHQ